MQGAKPPARWENGSVFSVDVDIGSYTDSDFTSSVDGDEHTFTVNPDTDPSTVAVDAAADVCIDPAENVNAGAEQSHSVTYDTSLLTVDSITFDKTSPTNESPVSATIVFSEEVAGFAANDTDIGNGWLVSIGGFHYLNNPILLVDMEAGNEGLVTVQVPAAAATAVATGRENHASGEYAFIYDTSAPDALQLIGVSPGDFNSNQYFTLDGESGAGFQYSLDGGGAWSDYSGEVTISRDGTYDITAR